MPGKLWTVGQQPMPRLKLTDELDWNAIAEELTEHFNSNKETRAAKDALARLESAGCDKRIILQNLYLFCGGDPHSMQSLRKAMDFEGRRRKILAIGELLEAASSGIQVAEELLADLDLTCYFTPDRFKLEKYAELLKRIGNTVYRELTSKRVSGRDQHLLFLCRMVGRVTGKPHYREIADLVTATKRHYSPAWTGVETEDGIRKRVSRHGPTDVGIELELELMELRKASQRCK